MKQMIVMLTCILLGVFIVSVIVGGIKPQMENIWEKQAEAQQIYP